MLKLLFYSEDFAELVTFLEFYSFLFLYLNISYFFIKMSFFKFSSSYAIIWSKLTYNFQIKSGFLKDFIWNYTFICFFKCQFLKFRSIFNSINCYILYIFGFANRISMSSCVNCFNLFVISVPLAFSIKLFNLSLSTFMGTAHHIHVCDSLIIKEQNLVRRNICKN